MKSTSKKLLSVLFAVSLVSCITACSENNPNSVVSSDSVETSSSTVISTTKSEEILFTATETSMSSDTTTTPVNFEDIEVITESSTQEEIPSTSVAEITVPAYNPGQPDIALYLNTTDIYPETNKITFTIETANEIITSNDFDFYKETDNGWEKLERQNAISLNDSITVTNEHPLVLNLYPADYGITFSPNEYYRISKKIGNEVYDTYFGVGVISPPLTKKDIKMTIKEGSRFTLDDEGFNLNYEYIGGAEYAEYGFGCYYTLEKRNEKGEWEEVQFSEDACFIDLGYLISSEYPTNSTHVSLKDDFYAEPLSAGTYRVVKPIENDVVLTALFKINDKYGLNPSATEKDIKMSIDAPEISSDTEYVNLVFEYIGEDNFAEFAFGQEFYIEKENDGHWEKVEFADNAGFDDIAYMIGTEYPESVVEIFIGKSLFKNPLSEGKYRIVKPMNVIDDIFNLTAEFNITKGHFTSDDFNVNSSLHRFPDDDKERKMTINYEYIGNDEDIDVWIYEDYRLQKINSDGKWEEIPMKNNIFGSSVQKINKDNPIVSETIEIKDEYFKKPLTEGKYRIVKDLCDCTSVTAEFFIGEPKFFKATIREESLPITVNSRQILIDIEYIGNETNFEYEFNMGSYNLERFENGKWHHIKFSDEACFNDGIDLILPEQKSFTLYCDLDDRSYEEPITAGSYRVVHHSYQGINAYVEFKIEEAERVIDREEGSLTLTINEIRADGFVCSLPWPYPATYIVECDTSEYDDYCVGDNIEVEYKPMYKVSEWEYLLIPTAINMSDFQLQEGVDYKPVIYLYPEEETEVSVNLDYNGRFTVTYPEYGDGWNVTAMPDGTLFDENGNEYSYLFWEGESNTEYDFSRGFCVKGEDTVEFLRWALSTLGLTPREYNEFIVFWLPFMQDNKYNIISFQSDAYTDNAVLTVTPEPDTVLRVFMAFYASDDYIEINEQELTTTVRNGFTVVEWGGAIVK